MNEQLQTTPEELFMLLGEATFVKHRQSQRIRALLIQADEMAKVIESLRKENGRLEQPANNDAV